MGLLAGSGRFPIAFAEKAKALGIPVVCVGIHYEASEELIPLVDSFHWSGVARMGRMIRCFRRSGVKQAVMAGKIQKTRMHTPLRWLRLMPDWRTIRFWFGATQGQPRRFSAAGNDRRIRGRRHPVRLGPGPVPGVARASGVLTQKAPSAQDGADIEFGWNLAREMGRLDVGQSVAVREKAVLAVEAIEGTDRAIARAGELCPRGGFTVVKVAKPQQDMRFDVPTVGVATIETMKKAGATVLAIEAGRTIILDEAETVRLADRYGIVIVARS